MRSTLSLALAGLAACGPVGGSPTTTDTTTSSTTNNVPPNIGTLAFQTSEDVALTFTLLATDTDGDPLTFALTSAPALGTAALAGDQLTYTPHPDVAGIDQLSVEVSDGVATVSTQVTLTILAVNDAPVAEDLVVTTQEDTPLPITLPGTDIDGDALTHTTVTSPNNGAVSGSPPAVLYAPAPDFVGTDQFTIEVSDGLASIIATVTIDVQPANDAPFAKDDEFTIPQNSVWSFTDEDLLANDGDPDGDALTVAGVGPAPTGSLSTFADHRTYAPPPGFIGTIEIPYEISDGVQTDGATLVFEVVDADELPIANDDDYELDEDDTLVVADPGVLDNDVDPDGDPLTATLVDAPEHGSVDLLPDGAFSYTPDEEFSGIDSFAYVAEDATGPSELAVVTIDVRPVDDAPIAEQEAYTTGEDVPLVVAAPGVLANDSDAEGDDLSADVVTPPAHGLLALDEDGSFTWTPGLNNTSPTSFTYVARATSGSSAPVVVSLTVEASADGPIAGDDAYAVDEDGFLAAPSVMLNDVDPDGDEITAALLSTTTNGVLTFAADGTFTYAPMTNVHGVDTFTYTVSDGTTSDTATVTLTILPTNDAPTAVADAYDVDGGARLVLAPGVLGNDIDIDGDDLTAVLSTPPGFGTLLLNANGSFTYIAADGYAGLVTFTYAVSDGIALSAPATVTLIVVPENEAPFAAADFYDTEQGVPLFVTGADGVLSNDTDPEDAPLIAELVIDADHGDLAFHADGSFEYTPPDGYTGQVMFDYVAVDPEGATSELAIVCVVVTGSPVPPPTAVPDTYAGNEDSTIVVAVDDGVLANDLGDDLTAILITQPSHGVVTLNADGSFTYGPRPLPGPEDFAGTDTWSYAATNDGGTSVTTVDMVLAQVNDAPRGNPDFFFAGLVDEVIVVGAPGVLDNDGDPEGDPMTVSVGTPPSHGLLSLAFDGAFTYTPDAAFVGADSFTYIPSDGLLAGSPVLVTLDIL